MLTPYFVLITDFSFSVLFELISCIIRNVCTLVLNTEISLVSLSFSACDYKYEQHFITNYTYHANPAVHLS